MTEILEIFDRDGIFMDRLEDDIFDAWNKGQITLELRTQLSICLDEIRGELGI